MPVSPILWLYRLAWEPALWAARVASRLPLQTVHPRRWRLRERLEASHEAPSLKSQPVLWMHAASLGECKGLWAVAESLSRKAPEQRFLLTANTVEGLEHLRACIAKTGEGGQVAVQSTARLAPLDHPRVVRGFLRANAVTALVLFEIELWPHFILEAKRAGLPVLWISALSTRSARIARGAVRRIDWIQAQSEDDARALRSLGDVSIEVGTDLRGLHYLADRTQDRTQTLPVPSWSERRGVALVSMHADELDAIRDALADLAEDLPVYVLPRKQEEWNTFHAALGPQGFVLDSRDPAQGGSDRQPHRRIIDAFGRVEETLATCRVAVIGGSYAPHSGHNLWEPLHAGVHIATGPHHESQRTLADRLETAGLLRVSREIPDLAALHAAADPGEACRGFAAAEAARLGAALEAIALRLKGLKGSNSLSDVVTSRIS